MSKTIAYYNKNEITKLSQPEALDVKVNQSLLQQAYVIYQGNNQRSIGHTKTRAEVSGTGKKPWKQKGTGRARAGSTRSPLWIGGGITFGPRSNKNYTRKLTVNEKKLALKMLFKLAVDAERLIVIDSLPEVNKTKDAVAWLVKLPIQEGRVLIIDNKIDHLKAFRNLPYVSFQSSLSPHFDRIATSDWIVMTKEAFEKLTGGKIDSEPVKPAVKKSVKKEVES